MGVKKTALLLLLLLLAASVSAAHLAESKATIEGSELRVEMLFSNSSDSAEDVTLSVNYLGQIDTVVESVPPSSTKAFTYRISNPKPGEILFAVHNSEESFVRVVVPENYAEGSVLLVHGASSAEWKSRLPGGPLPWIGGAFGHLVSSPDAIAVATVLLAVVAVLLGLKIAFREKTSGEKKAEMNEKLLREAGAIEEKRKRVKRMLKP